MHCKRQNNYKYDKHGSTSFPGAIGLLTMLGRKESKSVSQCPTYFLFKDRESAGGMSVETVCCCERNLPTTESRMTQKEVQTSLSTVLEKK